jgi:hypothetical protein
MHFLQLLGAARRFPSSVSYAGAGGSRSFRTIHTRLTFPETHGASSTRSNPISRSPPRTPNSARAPLAILPASPLCCSANFICRNGVGRPEKPCLGATQLFANGIEAPHATTLSGTSSPGRLPEHGEYWTPHRCLPSCPANCRHSLQRRAAGPLKRVGKLQHAGFCKRRPKDLQPHGQLARQPPARHRDAWQAR